MGKRGRIWVFGGLILLALGLALALWPPGSSSQSTTSVDSASLQDSVQVELTSSPAEEVPPAGGGATDQGRVKESVEYVIRDSKGKIKGQKSLGGR
jgi:hypothetical protein